MAGEAEFMAGFDRLPEKEASSQKFAPSALDSHHLHLAGRHDFPVPYLANDFYRRLPSKVNMSKHSVSLFLLVVALLSLTHNPISSAQSSSPPALPYSPSLDLTSMDKSVDPCVDLYTYSCGGWQKKNPIPPDQTSWSVYGKLYQDNLTFLRGMLEQAAQPSSDRNAFIHACGVEVADLLGNGIAIAAGLGGRLEHSSEERQIVLLEFAVAGPGSMI